MTNLFKKLNFKEHQNILVLKHPESFESDLKAMQPFTRIHTRASSIKEIEFVMLFVQDFKTLEKLTVKVFKKCKGDVIFWMCYPKKSSKKYKSEINRDSKESWEIMGKAGFEGVRQVAIDQDWSALRFRKPEFIKQLKRDPKRAISKTGKARTKKKD